MPDAYNNRGWAYYKSRPICPSFIDYNQAIDIDPNFAIAYNNRGFAYYRQGELSTSDC